MNKDILEQNMRMTEDRIARCERSCAAGAGNVRTAAAKLGKVQNAALINVGPNKHQTKSSLARQKMSILK